jgi:hypothetical protein
LNNNRVEETKKVPLKLPAFFPPILAWLKPQGFSATLVGGSVRDYFLTGVLGKDWDIELTHDTLAWNQQHWKDTGRGLGKFGRVTFLPYDVIRLEASPFVLEFSPPRIETFTEERHHKNFSARFDFQLPFSEAVLRRDFTINAMGLRFDDGGASLLDPLNGLLHLREKLLHQCGPDFSRDPVRFLRALRFGLRFGFSSTAELEREMARMHLDQLSPQWIWNEMQKSGAPADYYQLLLQQQELHPELRLPTPWSVPMGEVRPFLRDPRRHESWMIALEWAGLSCEDWQRFFSLSSESCRRLGNWARSSRFFQTLGPEAFHGEFDAVCAGENFLKLFDWYFTTRQLLQKNPDLPLLEMIEEYLPAWIHLYRFEPLKDVRHIDPPLRAKYQVWNLCQRL